MEAVKRVEIRNELRLSKDSLSPETIGQIKAALTMPNPAYESAIAHGRAGWGISETLAFYDETEAAMVLPRGFGPELSRLLGTGVSWLDNRRVMPEIDLTFNGVLRGYQDEATRRIIVNTQGVLEAGTGSGKTIMALAVIAARKQPALILVHNIELLTQWQERVRQFLGVEAGQVGAGKCDVKPVTVGIVNSVRTRLDEIAPRFGHVVVDECHRCPSTMFTECVRGFDARFLLGLSATPYRRDGLTSAIGL